MKYKVRVLGLQAKRKTPYKSGDIIDESALIEGSIDRLLAGGYIEIADESAEAIDEDVPNYTPSTAINLPESDTEKKSISDITVKELKSYLDEKQITYNPLAKKAELYDLYHEN